MGDQQALTASIDDFFSRMGLTPQDQLECYRLVGQLYPGSSITPAPCQGYCSLTMFVANDKVIQFRPYDYRLDLRITEAARKIYGEFAPDTKYITTITNSKLLVYGMSRVQGVSFKDLRLGNAENANSPENLSRLCEGFAIFLSTAWTRRKRSDIELGVVGQSISTRLAALSISLPPRFRNTARQVLRQICQVEDLPWVLTHGDIMAGNIMVEPSSGHLLGFVDWAEAEHLPFGISLYGLEEILGEITSTGFQYHPDSNALRESFWNQLKKEIPDLQNKHVLQAVQLARDLGVLLWHGIAFDNGAIDRVVEEGKDLEEIMRLDAFLGSHKSHFSNKSSKI